MKELNEQMNTIIEIIWENFSITEPLNQINLNLHPRHDNFLFHCHFCIQKLSLRNVF